MVKKAAVFLITLSLSAMEWEIKLPEVKIQPNATFEQQAEFMVDVYFNGSAQALKPKIVPKLTRKLEESPHRHSISLAELPHKKKEDINPQEKAVLEYADQLLATAIHEVLADKEVEVEQETKKKKYAMIAAIAGGVGTLGTAIAAALVHVVGAGCLDCIDECVNITQSGLM